MNIKLSFYPRSNHFTALLLAAALSLGSATVSHAASIIVPAGVQPGDTYRIIFVTSAKRNATSSNIADYNQFVTNAANLSPELQSLNTTWTALASTSATNVLANTGLSLSDTNTRFFHTFGQLIATGVSGSNSSLFGGATTLHGARISTEAGVFVIGPNNVSLVWTSSAMTASASGTRACRTAAGSPSAQFQTANSSPFTEFLACSRHLRASPNPPRSSCLAAPFSPSASHASAATPAKLAGSLPQPVTQRIEGQLAILADLKLPFDPRQLARP